MKIFVLFALFINDGLVVTLRLGDFVTEEACVAEAEARELVNYICMEVRSE